MPEVWSLVIRFGLVLAPDGSLIVGLRDGPLTPESYLSLQPTKRAETARMVSVFFIIRILGFKNIFNLFHAETDSQSVKLTFLKTGNFRAENFCFFANAHFGRLDAWA